jgi:hypothetical protein
MDENAEETLARIVADLSPEEYERFGPGVRELGLALAERRVALREVDRARELQERVLEGYDRAKEDLERAEERTHNALRLIEDAL